MHYTILKKTFAFGFKRNVLRYIKWSEIYINTHAQWNGNTR